MALSYHIKQIIAFENTSMPLLLIFSFVQVMPLTTSGYLHSVFDYAVVLCVFDYAVILCVRDYYKVGQIHSPDFSNTFLCFVFSSASIFSNRTITPVFQASGGINVLTCWKARGSCIHAAYNTIYFEFCA